MMKGVEAHDERGWDPMMKGVEPHDEGGGTPW